MRSRRALCLVVATAALVGQGCGGEDENSDQEAITAVVNELFAAQESGDAETACTEVYVIREDQRRAGLPEEELGESEESEEGEESEESEEGVEPEEGEESEEGEEGESPGECEETFEAASEQRDAEVKDLSTAISSIAVDGDRATATVHTELERIDGSHLSQDVPYDLVRTDEGWRIRIADEG